MIWGNVGSDLLPRAVLDIVEDGNAVGGPRRSTAGRHQTLITFPKAGVIADGLLGGSPYVDAEVIRIKYAPVYWSAREAW